MTNLKADTKRWFEANYFDGDEVQEGQMLSSEECLDALLSHEEKVVARVIEKIKEEHLLTNEWSMTETIRNTEVRSILETVSSLTLPITDEVRES